MVQEFQVLRCSSCQVFQVHQVRRSSKWTCKLCGDKQSQLKVYGQGSAVDCRHHVQKLNLLQGQVEWAAADNAGESCQNAICDDYVGNETKQSVMVSQEAAPVSRWYKYLEDNRDATYEEGEGLTSNDHEDYYSHQACAPRGVRKVEHFPSYGGDFYETDIEENVSKKKKIYEGGNPLETTSQSSSRITEDMDCLKWHDKPQSQTLSLQLASHIFLPMNTWKRHFKQSTYNTESFLEREPKRDAIFNHFYRKKKIGPECSVTSTQDILPNDDEPPTTSRLSAQMISSPARNPSGLGGADQQSGSIVKTSSSVSLQKPVIQSHLFQTDEDFDDNY